MRGEKHKVAAQLASVRPILRFIRTFSIDEDNPAIFQRSYESYTLERYLLRKEEGSSRVRVMEWEGRDVRGIED